MKIALMLLLLCGCASQSPNYLPYGDEDSNADAAAWSAGNMQFRKSMPKHAPVQPWEFYFKHCSVNGDETMLSKTAYDCTGPAF